MPVFVNTSAALLVLSDGTNILPNTEADLTDEHLVNPGVQSWIADRRLVPAEEWAPQVPVTIEALRAERDAALAQLDVERAAYTALKAERDELESKLMLGSAEPTAPAKKAG